MRRSTAWALLAFASVIPIATPAGALYGVEPVLVGGAVLIFLRRGHSLVVPRVALVPVVLAVVLAVDLAIGRHGGVGYIGHMYRVVAMLFSLLIVLANVRISARFAFDVLVKACLFVTLACVAERFIGFAWDRSKLFADIDRSYRVGGPLGPGATATVLMAGAYASLMQRRYFYGGSAIVGILLLASRSHVLALAVMFVGLVVSNRLRSRQIAAVFAAGTIASALVPSGIDRLLAAFSGAERARSRLSVWREVFDVADWGTLWGGLGPGAFSFQVDSRTVAHQAHSQFLTPWVDYGLVGLGCLAYVLWALWRRAGRTRTRPFLVGWLTAGVFAEVIFAPTVPLMIGALPAWLIIWFGVPQRFPRWPLVAADGAARVPTSTTQVVRG